ncbi:MAG: formate dehydrogenase accessory sulfurtransferase FdhD [Eggerthellaceae bacterium]|nr:formate dehydrogenase accessory sulfurtransferase FdhD [Eggerthellaceae bacterium]
MQVVDRYREEERIVGLEATLLNADGRRAPAYRTVLAEHVMEVTVNTVPTLRVVCTPDHLVDLVVGRLFTEGIIGGIDDVAGVYLCDQGTRASVLLTHARGDFSRQGVEEAPSCCTGNRVYNAYFTSHKRPPAVTPIPWEAEWVFSAARAFAEDTPLHRATTGTHSCYLLLDGTIVCCCEDLGRHNAFDKAVGVALRAGIDLRDVMVYSSGRLPVDMVMKAIRAGIPVLASKAVPTDETVRLAREYRLTLLCQARPDSVLIYHDPFADGEAAEGDTYLSRVD